MTTATLEPKPTRRRRKLVWLIPVGAWMLLILPVVLLAGAGNPPCPSTGTPNPSTPPGGPAPGGMYAQPLKLQQGKWYEVGATDYSGNEGSIGGSEGYLPAHPDTFAELSVLDSNPWPNFTFADGNALNNLPYMTGLIVANNGTKKVLYKRDVGYGQGPGQFISNGQPYRVDVWWESAAPLGVSKNAANIALAPPLGTGGVLGQAPAPVAGSRCQPALRRAPGQRPAAADPRPAGADPLRRQRRRPRRRATGGEARDRGREPHPHHLLQHRAHPGDADHHPTVLRLLRVERLRALQRRARRPAGHVGAATAGDSTLLEGYGDAGPGRWITIYANSGHVWLAIAGLAFDTADFGGPDIPAGTGPRWRQNPTGNLADGLSYVTRHPPGL